MAGPDVNSLLNDGALISSQSPQHSAAQHFAIYSTTSSCLTQQLGKQESGFFNSFHQPLHHSFLEDFTDVQRLNESGDGQLFQQHGGNLVGGGSPVVGGNGMEDRLSARRMHKADREKLRRDKLNEQFSDLANALDPDRPKNDKATILGESVQVVKELREEVKRLKTEHTSLLNESRDLSQEKNELREEKAALKSETEQLQSQLQQRLRAMSPWMALDPSMVMGPAAFPYPVAVPQPVSVPPDSHQVGPPRALVPPTPYMPIAPPLGAFPMHPSLQAFAMYGNRPGDGGNPYLPYPSFPQPVSSHSHIERPYAQYPSPVQPVPGYVVQIPPSQGSQSQISPPASAAPVYRPCVPGIPVLPVQNSGSSQRQRGSNHCLPASQGSSQQAPINTEQEDPGIMASQCHIEVSQAPGVLGTTAEPCCPEEKDTCSDKHLGKAPIAASIVPPTFLLDRSGLSLDTERISLAEKGPTDLRSCSEDELEQVHDPTLRPAAA